MRAFKLDLLHGGVGGVAGGGEVFGPRDHAEDTATSDAVEVELVTRKNLGTYGSGVNETTLKLKNPADAK